MDLLNPFEKGCVPSNKEDGTVVRPDTSLLTKHFRYECAYDEASDTVTMKISRKFGKKGENGKIRKDCVDHNGKLVKVGEFFTHPPADNNSEQFTRVECVGNEFMAKKVVHKCQCAVPSFASVSGHSPPPQQIKGPIVRWRTAKIWWKATSRSKKCPESRRDRNSKSPKLLLVCTRKGTSV